MVRTLSLLLLAAGVAGQTSTTPVPTPAVSNPPFTMTLVNSIQARVVAEAATWDETNQKFGLVLKQNTNTFEERYRAVMDTVNTASVEGALYYVQTEGIDKPLQTGCMRKTNMSYIWFLNITMVQPTFAIAEYQDNGGVVPEYGKFVAMDGGLCTPVGTETPLECLTYGGLNFNKNLGQWVGGEARKKNGRANYDDNYWFSFPNSCYTMRFDAKTKACRDLQKGGLCPIGTQPDGVKCTYSFDVLGYLAIDDLVGITSMKNTLTGQNFKGFSEFCKAGKTEYNFADSSSDLTFWNDPLEPAANANRTKVMMQKYNDLVQNGVGDQKHMKALPSVEELTKANPPCWKNSPRCATAANGCRRKLLSQICEVCSAPADDCKKPGPNDKAAPMLNKHYHRRAWQHARVVSDAATWDETNKKFGLVLKQNTNTFEERYRAAMDTVNTASVEGALFYVQTEGINRADSVQCMRKTNMSYIWFLNITIVQPTYAIAEYADNGGVVPEFGKFMAMDNGQCTPVNAKAELSDECQTVSGLNYHKNIGPYIGGEARLTHAKGNYADNYWFSYPNSCYSQTFVAKNDKCRKTQPGGLCPLGTQPDGVKCTYSFDILGYIRIDDLVGITSMKNAKTGEFYRDRVDFCKDGKVEYDFDAKSSDLTFWDNPLDVEANKNRTSQMLKLYNSMLKDAKGDYAHMKPLPSIEDLTKANPPCWMNSPRCATATNGCRRKLSSQICEVCSSPAADCKKPTSSDKVPPPLTKAALPPLPTNADGKTTIPRPVAVPGASGAPGDAAAGVASDATSAAIGASALVVMTAFLL
uniref:Secreted protein n=1 Tax=Achlya hypogyna TaxID=1202772 RepID=A0A0A7CLN2_ACHHY|nr:secreted protein [Achlya hypogyna]